jgi:hypothetical protein
LIAALFVEPKGIYAGLEGVELWDAERDARKYAGPWPVVAHPPCARWSMLAALVEKRYPYLRQGEDDGCFESALASVRKYGGVLEHPAFTKAWAAYGIPNPVSNAGWQRTIDGGWVCEVSQAAYGHRVQKMTWLYAVTPGMPPLMNWGRPGGSATMTWLTNHGGRWARMGRKERNATPILFRDALIKIANLTYWERWMYTSSKLEVGGTET